MPIHLTISERAELAETVFEYPKVGPAMLMTGIPKLYGHTKPVTEISPTLLNADHVKYKVGKICKPSQISGSEFLHYAQFCADHPNFVINFHVSDCIVLSMQLSVLAGQFVKEIIPNEAINGIVWDAAHDYWLDKTPSSPSAQPTHLFLNVGSPVYSHGLMEHQQNITNTISMHL